MTGGILNGLNRLERGQIMNIAVEAWHVATTRDVERRIVRNFYASPILH